MPLEFASAYGCSVACLSVCLTDCSLAYDNNDSRVQWNKLLASCLCSSSHKCVNECQLYTWWKMKMNKKKLRKKHVYLRAMLCCFRFFVYQIFSHFIHLRFVVVVIIMILFFDSIFTFSPNLKSGFYYAHSCFLVLSLWPFLSSFLWSITKMLFNVFCSHRNNQFCTFPKNKMLR